MTLSRVAGIRAAESRAIRLVDGHAVAIKRFDRAGRRRVHALSANVALKAAGEELGYRELAQLLRRRGTTRRPAHVQSARKARLEAANHSNGFTMSTPACL